MYQAYVKITQMRIERYCYGKLYKKKNKETTHYYTFLSTFGKFLRFVKNIPTLMQLKDEASKRGKGCMTPSSQPSER